MPKDIRVLIVEDDPYSRDMMAMLLTRDWRTRVVGEFGSDSANELVDLLRQPAGRVDIVIVDTEVPGNPHWPFEVSQLLAKYANHARLLYLCTQPDPALLARLPAERFGGYLVKGEILYSLAAAVSAAAAGEVVITPGVQQVASAVDLPAKVRVFDGAVPVAEFTHRESDLVRLGILFNLAQRDIADELVVSTDFVAEMMSSVYGKLGLHAILSGESSLEDYFSDENLLAHYRAILTASGALSGKRPRKTPWMATMAFHLLTIPEVQQR